MFPTEPGWVETMKDFFSRQSDVGVLGPKLLYEDDSIQHAGMYFNRDVFPETDCGSICTISRDFQGGTPPPTSAAPFQR